ncbi:MAG: bifunctional folylpolyglutamate synthase/dihydrofolate synthase [Eggerthellaceae bacterium]|nr:bifunctional folylpolyglutamate synthase/dihydrofolate synthase [Eggerthellaceae bacterium]
MAGFDPVAYINEPRWQESRLGLERIVELLNRMGRPQDRLRFVHVAGTNGKGSTCAYIASILQTAGMRVGLFTSPYVIEFAERIRVNGANIPPEALAEVTLFVREHAEAMAASAGEHPTEFELMTAVAFEYFARESCDIVVCEVGLGGRLDSTNVIELPEVCVITRLGLDHTGFLGDTSEAIAREKAGIVKAGAPVVAWPQDDPAAMRVIEGAAHACESQLRVPEFTTLKVLPVEGAVRPFLYQGVRYTTKLLGSYQPSNAALAIEAARVLGGRGWNIGEDAIAQGIADARWPARFEVVSTDPMPLVIDGGHNPQGAVVLAQSLRDVFGGRPVVFVMSVLADKDYRSMIEQVAPLASAFVCAAPPNPRALAASDLAIAIREQVGQTVPVETVPDLHAALARARVLATPNSVICAFGSLYSISSLGT